MRSSIFEINTGVWFFASRSIPGPNSCHRFLPASLPTVEPKLLSGAPGDRLQYGVDAVSFATAVSARNKYEVFSLPFPDSSRVTTLREAACVARPMTFPPPAE